MNFNEQYLTVEPTSEFQKTIADGIASEGNANWDGSLLLIPHNKVYEIDHSRLSPLDLPELFSGYMIIKMQGTPNMPACRFSFHFANEAGQSITGETRIGSILKISRNELYFLPKEQYDICEQVLKANQSNDEFDRWSVVNMAKNGNKNIRFDGLAENDSIQIIKQVDLDLIQNPDGSITLDSKLSDITKKTQTIYDERLIQEGREGLVITEAISTGFNRYIVSKKVLKAIKRIRQKNKIPKEDVVKFISNPESFLNEKEEGESDIAINMGSYRIVGIGEPYIGYFGSVKIDSPIARALIQDNDPIIQKQIHDKVKETIDGRTMEELITLKEDVKKASEANCTSFESLDTEFFEPEYSEIQQTLSKVFKASKSITENGKPSKGVIRILPNDDIEIIIEEEVDWRKPLDRIATKNSDKGSLFSNIKFEPKKYQIEGVNWLIDLHESGYKGGILADDMGLGKTYQVIAFLNYLFYHKKINGRVLIVAPTILIDNWQNEIHKFIVNQSKFRVKILRGNDLGYRSDTKTQEEKSYNYFNPELLLEVEGHPTVIITTYQTMSNYQFTFAEVDKFKFDCIIYDEAHTIKNPNAQISQTAVALSSKIPFSVLLTGTPIENELRDLWALFDVFDPTHFGSWKKFKKEFVNTQSKEIDDVLRAKSSNYILRRLKKDYLFELPSKEERVRKVTLNKNEEEEYLGIVNSDQMALTRLHKLKAFSIHKILTSSDRASHAQIERITFESYSKIKELLRLLEEIRSKQEKVIIFIINRLGQDILRFGVSDHFGGNVDIINGSNNDQASVKRKLDAFKKQEGFAVIILSPLAAGVGLTITEANHVIHYERWWNASKEDQASDRVYRIGQDKNVYIHHIISKLPSGRKSIDEAIHELITKKRETAGFLVPQKSISDNEMAKDLFDDELSIAQQIDMLDWEGFEYLIKRLYEAIGYKCELTPGGGQPEYGADIIATQGKEILAIQCKHSQKGTVKGKEAIYQLHAESRSYYKTDKLIAVTNSHFDNSAINLAKEHTIQILQRDDLFNLINKYNIFI
jgi:SNF2 family DNA or RNA helicase/Holliday junction resolvase